MENKKDPHSNSGNLLEVKIDSYLNRKERVNNVSNSLLEKSSVISEREISDREEIYIMNSLKSLFLFQDLNDFEMYIKIIFYLLKNLNFFYIFFNFFCFVECRL